MDMVDKVVVISGASSGIGKSLAKALAAKGANVVILARRLERLQEVAAQLKASGRQVLAVQADVTNPEQVQDAIKRTIETFGRIDAVINNAGVGYFGTIEKLPPSELDRLLKTNVYGMLHVSQAAIPALKRSRGMIVNISSGLSKRAVPFLSAYSGTKSMIDALSDGMRVELKKDGVKVLNYCPPETETEFFDPSRIEAGLNPDRTGQRKMAKPEEVASRIVQAMIQEKREVVEGRFLQIMNFFAPKMLDQMFYKSWVQKVMQD